MNRFVDVNGLFSLYYNKDKELYRIVRTHSEQVARKALTIAADKQLPVDREFVYCAALLHDIGVVKCNAPGIMAFGKLPYICHGVEGRKILEKEGLLDMALVCERHTGSGITRKQIITNNLPLPKRNMLPVSLEEKLICYADKFFSKSHDLKKEKDLEEILKQMEFHGKDSLYRFLKLHAMFGD